MLELGLQYYHARSQPGNKSQVSLNPCMGFGIVAEITKHAAFFQSFNIVTNVLERDDEDVWMIRVGLLIQLSK